MKASEANQKVSYLCHRSGTSWDNEILMGIVEDERRKLQVRIELHEDTLNLSTVTN